MRLSVGDVAPQFTLPDQNGTWHTLEQYKGKWVFLFFYPKDDTPGCTTEVCSIKDSYKAFNKKNVVPLGVSFDTIKSHAKFVKKFDLPFTLLADMEKVVIQAYDCWGQKEFMGREYMGTYRTSFLINPEGKIAKIYENVKPKEHMEKVVGNFKNL